MNQTKTRYVLILILIIFIVGLTAYFSTKNNDNHLAISSKNLQKVESWYLLEMPNLNFQISFPQEPNFHRTDGKDFTRYTWSYIDDSGNALFLQAENNLYAYNPTKRNFVEESARLYGGVVSSFEENSNLSTATYQISGVYSASTDDTDTIIGKMIDVNEWTFVLTNQYNKNNQYPEFITSFKRTN